jgi:uncharacterized membrane protein
MSRLRRWWLDLNSSLWFVPSLMVLAAILAAYGLVHLDQLIGHDWTQRYPLLFGAGADGARGMLSAIAGSMITVADLIFSLTFSTLAQVSSQYTSRLLRNFMRDRSNQVVMGFFVSIFVYCLIVLRTIRGGDEGAFVPSLAVTFGLLLALVSIGMLIFFIHHIASSIQAANLVAGAADETQKLLDKLFPKSIGEPASHEQAADLAAIARLTWVPVPAAQSGYVQGIDDKKLLTLAAEGNLVFRMEEAIGSFATQGSALMSVASYDTARPWLPANDFVNRLNAAYSLGNQRSLDQDFGFGLRQLVDIALKALSPGVNDTSTGVMCLDRLGTLLALLAERPQPAPRRPGAHSAAGPPARFRRLPRHSLRPDTWQRGPSASHLPAPVSGAAHHSWPHPAPRPPRRVAPASRPNPGRRRAKAECALRAKPGARALRRAASSAALAAGRHAQKSPGRSRGILFDAGQNLSLRRERRAAAAGAFGLGVVEGEAAGVEAVLEVNFHAQHIHGVLFIHDELHAVEVVDFVVVFGFIETQQVAHARAATALHPDAQAVIGGHALLLNDVFYFD